MTIAADPLAALLPGRSEEEMGLRRRIFTAQQVGGARMHTLQSDDARWLNQLLLEKAMTWTYAAADIDLLGDRVNFLLRLAMLATEADRLAGYE